MGFSFWHFLFFTVLALLIFGPKRLPQLGKAFGETMRNYRKSLNGEGDIDVTDSVKRLDTDDDEERKS